MNTAEVAVEFAVRKFGVSALKDKQKERITKFIEGNDIFTSLPTGYGKSMIIIWSTARHI